jgi:hypothetical protein
MNESLLAEVQPVRFERENPGQQVQKYFLVEPPGLTLVALAGGSFLFLKRRFSK